MIEDLHVRNMLHNHSLARAISDAGWRDLRSMLEYKCQWYGRDLVVVDRWLPSSKVCSACGALQDRMPLSVREWTCRCGAVHDRDVTRPATFVPPGWRCSPVETVSDLRARKRTLAIVGEAGTLPGDRENPRRYGEE